MTPPTKTLAIGLAVLAAASALLLGRLGRQALWDDEANTALFAEAILRTGDLSAYDGRNLVAFRNGSELRGLAQRYLPPLPYYLTAPSLGLLGRNAFAARLPAALGGVACVLWILGWLREERADATTVGLWGLALLGNVSLFLYFRQCRYYGPAILATVALAYFYTRRDRSRGDLAGMVLASLVLFSSSYLNYAAAYACLAVDYAVWGRRERPLRPRQWLWLLAPQVLIGLPVALLWNPLGKEVVAYRSPDWLRDKLTLFWWNLRDLNRAEFGALIVLLAAPVVAWLGRRTWLARASAACWVYLAAITLSSPQPVGLTVAADVRYLAPLIPLLLMMGVSVLLALGRVLPRAVVWALGLVLFGTNLPHLAAGAGGEVHSSPARFVGELADPPADAYGAAARWIDAHAGRGRSVLVLPGYATYPLMFHAPGPVYAWQLRDPPAAQFRALPEIHRAGRLPPDYVVIFGPEVRRAAALLHFPAERAVRYEPAGRIDLFWVPPNRPELFWHAFRPITRFDRRTEGVLILRRAWPPIAGRAGTP